MSDHEINKIITSYLSGQANDKELEKVSEWVNASDLNKNQFSKIKKYWETSKMDVTSDRTSIALAKLNERIFQDRPEATNEPNIIATPAARKFPQRFIQYAAAAMVLIAVGLYYFTFNVPEVVQQQVALVQKANTEGVKSQVQLPDGTHVWLNAASSISYSENFSDTARLIDLKGEAYFEVVKDVKRPFRVTTGRYVTTALGTSFNINSFDSNNIKVSLLTGKVDVKDKQSTKSVLLLPGDQAYIDQSQLVATTFNEFGVVAWKNGTISFDNTNFDEMIDVLERWYDVKFVVQNLSDDEKNQLLATGKFKKQTLKNVLDVLSHSMKFQYSIDKKTITIKF